MTGGSIEFHDCTIEAANADNGGAFQMSGAASLLVTGGRIVSCSASTGGVLALSGGSGVAVLARAGGSWVYQDNSLPL